MVVCGVLLVNSFVVCFLLCCLGGVMNVVWVCLLAVYVD